MTNMIIGAFVKQPVRIINNLNIIEDRITWVGSSIRLQVLTFGCRRDNGLLKECKKCTLFFCGKTNVVQSIFSLSRGAFIEILIIRGSESHLSFLEIRWHTMFFETYFNSMVRFLAVVANFESLGFGSLRRFYAIIIGAPFLIGFCTWAMNLSLGVVVDSWLSCWISK